jgi:DNA (cytosine-5)-methyltransferase 1
MPIEAATLYNEIEPHAAAWLRNLIALGELPDGVVDERSIVDVRGADLDGSDELHFFAGIGVWARAVAEAEQASNRRLARPLFTGSCPCQPLSVAGQRKGHLDERHLWPAFHRLIAERRPATILGEQVADKDGREWMAAVRHDLEASGYAVGTAILPAGGLGAPHLRYRMFFVAHADSGQSEQFAWQGAGTIEAAGWRAYGELAGRGDAGGLADASGAGLAQRERIGGVPGRAHRADAGQALERDGATGGLADAEGQWRGRERGELREPQENGIREISRQRDRRVEPGRGGATGGLADAEGHGLPKERHRNGPPGLHVGHGLGADGGSSVRHHAERDPSSSAGNAEASRLRGGMERPRSPCFWSDADWIFCRDAKWRPIEPGSFPLVDGSAFLLGSGGPYEGMSRAGMLRGYGNAVVLPVARAFVECAMEALHAH